MWTLQFSKFLYLTGEEGCPLIAFVNGHLAFMDVLSPCKLHGKWSPSKEDVYTTREMYRCKTKYGSIFVAPLPRFDRLTFMQCPFVRLSVRKQYRYPSYHL